MAPGGQRIGPCFPARARQRRSAMAPTITRSWNGQLRSVRDTTPSLMTSQASRCGRLPTVTAAMARWHLPRQTPSTASSCPDRTAVTKSW
jgi:hypothetical protein